MNLGYCSLGRKKGRAGHGRGFTLMELMVASAIAFIFLTIGAVFVRFASTAISGITSQSVMNDQAGYTVQFIQDRARLATSISNDTSGNILTLGFDDNFSADSNGDGKRYNDRDHYEQFWFIGTSATNVYTNLLVYLPNGSPTNTPVLNATNHQVLIASGVRKLLGQNVFSVVSSSIAIIKFGIVDSYDLDHHQSIDIQTTAVPLNRTDVTNIISILP
jgi:prepilin-type N-terminal cleavage/methylation domain-containing protein